jgi:hypothetical protein
MDLPKHHKDKFVKCEGQDCPFCAAGFPRKLVTPFFDFVNGTVTYLTINADSKIAEMLYGDQWNPRKEIKK